MHVLSSSFPCDDVKKEKCAGVPGGLASGPRAYKDQFRGFKSCRVHARKGFISQNNILAQSAKA